MSAAVEQATRSQTPWTLDPVAVGALDYRRRFCVEHASPPLYVPRLADQDIHASGKPKAGTAGCHNKSLTGL